MRVRARTSTLLSISIGILAASLAVSCGGDDGDDSDDTSSGGGVTGTTTGGAAVTGVLAEAFPGNLALSAFPQSVDATSLSLEADAEDKAKIAAQDKKTIKDRIEDNNKLANGTADSCFNDALFSGHQRNNEITCYEFDSDMNPSQFSGQDTTYGTKDGTDGNGEACMVAFARSQVQGAVDTVDQALALVGGMICQAQKDGVAQGLPAVGVTLDLAESFANATGDHLTVKSASLARLDDVTVDGVSLAVYKTDITVTHPDGGTNEVHLVHTPGTDDTGRGTLWFKNSGKADANAPANDPNNSANKNHVMSINYSKEAEGDSKRMRFEVRRASIVNTVEPFDDTGLVDYASVAEDAQNDQIHAINYISFDMDPDTNAGDLAYWMNPGGNYNESARGFLFNITADADSGVLKGCGTSGATSSVSIRKALGEPDDNTLEPVRYWHPRENQNTHTDKDPRFDANEGNTITKQCFKQNGDGVYAIDTDVTSHERGYDVIAQASAGVEPPKKPEHRIEGDFAKK